MKKSILPIAILFVCTTNLFAQNVGIGTSEPAYKLTVVNDGTSNIGIANTSSDGTVSVGTYVDNSSAYIQTHSNNDLNFATNSSNAQVTIQKVTGNVGIGNANPAQKLVVNGNAAISGDISVSGDATVTGNTNLQGNLVTINGNLRIAGGNPDVGKVLTSNGVGLASWEYPAKYTFVAKRTSGQTIVAGLVPTKVIFDDQTSEPGGYSASSFTAPKSAFYHFEVNLTLVNNTGNAFDNYVRVSLCRDNGGSATLLHSYTLPGTGSTQVHMGTVSFATTLLLQSGQTIDVRVENLTSNNIIVDGLSNPSTVLSSFSGYIIK